MHNKIGAVSLVITGKHLIGVKCNKGRGIILPGGKHEPGETFDETAARELREETGLVAISQKLIFHAMAPDGYYVYAYKTQVKDFWGFYTTDSGDVMICTWGDLLKSDYRAYYQILKEVMDNAAS